MRNFSGKRPTFRRIMRTISDGINYIMPFYLIAALAMILIPFFLVYTYMPDSLAAPVASAFGAIMTVVVVPIVLNQIKRDYANKDRFYKQNKELYIEVSKILIDILVAESEEHKMESVQPLDDFLDKYYSKMCIFFPEDLIWKLFSISREFNCEKYEYKNINQLAVKCLNIIRKSSGLNEKIYINQGFIEMIGKNRKNS